MPARPFPVKLSKKEREFLKVYASNGGDANDAARKLGYKQAGYGNILLKRPHIIEFMNYSTKYNINKLNLPTKESLLIDVMEVIRQPENQTIKLKAIDLACKIMGIYTQTNNTQINIHTSERINDQTLLSDVEIIQLLTQKTEEIDDRTNPSSTESTGTIETITTDEGTRDTTTSNEALN